MIARYAPERLFKIVFVMVAYFAAARLLSANENWKLGDDLPKGPLMRFFGLCVGLLATLMGVGGGLFANLLMTFYGRPIHQGVATSSALAVLVSIPGALGYVYAGWPVAAHYPEVAGAASSSRAGLCFADWRAAGDADEPFDRAARRAGRACDVEEGAGTQLRRVSVDRRHALCDQPVERAVMVAVTALRADYLA